MQMLHGFLLSLGKKTFFVAKVFFVCAVSTFTSCIFGAMDDA